MIVGKIIQNLIESENMRRKNLYINNLNLSNDNKDSSLNFNKEKSCGSIGNTNITSN
jgi:hypothetical protein